MTKITFVRHGNTDWNNEIRVQGHSHNPLSKIGEKQAEIVAKRLAEEEWDLLISSDLKRARQTAETISKKTGLDIAFYDERIREIGRGQIEGTIEEERIKKWGENWRDLDLGLETVEEVRARGIDFVKDMEKRYPNKKLLVVSHGILIWETLKTLIPDDPTVGPLSNCSVSSIEKTDQGWRYISYNCLKHFQQHEELVTVAYTKYE